MANQDLTHTPISLSSALFSFSSKPVRRSQPAPKPKHQADEFVRADHRVPFGGMVRLVFGELRDFVVACQGDISLGGMYLPTPTPLPVGSVLELELMLGDDLTLVRGRGQVMWAEDGAASKGARAGMGIRFLDLDQVGRDLIFRTVDRYIQMGGQPFDLDGVEHRSGSQPKFLSLSLPGRPQPAARRIAQWCSSLVDRSGMRPAGGSSSPQRRQTAGAS